MIDLEDYIASEIEKGNFLPRRTLLYVDEILRRAIEVVDSIAPGQGKHLINVLNAVPVAIANMSLSKSTSRSYLADVALTRLGIETWAKFKDAFRILVESKGWTLSRGECLDDLDSIPLPLLECVDNYLDIYKELKQGLGK